MRIDNSDAEKFPGKFEVIDVETGDEIEHIAWADDEAGTYAVFATRGRTLADAENADLRLYDSQGNPKVIEHKGEIEIIDLSVNPFKAPLLALLDDPEVKDKVDQKEIRLVVAHLLDAMKYLLRDDRQTAQDKLESARRRFHKAFLS